MGSEGLGSNEGATTVATDYLDDAYLPMKTISPMSKNLTTWTPQMRNASEIDEDEADEGLREEKW